jgi:hypothetical protein
LSALSSNDLLSIATLAHEAGLFGVWVAATTSTTVDGIPWVSRVMIAIMSVWSMVGGNVWNRNVGRMCLWLVSRIVVIEDGPVEAWATTRRAEVLGGRNGGVRRRWRRELWRRVIVDPVRLIVSRMETRLWAFQRGSLVVTIVVLDVGTRSLDVGIDLGKGDGGRGETIEGSLAFGILRLAPLFPAGNPCIVVVALIEIDVQIVVHALQPFMLQGVQLGNLDPADLRPGSVLEGVVVEKLASEQEPDGQHAPDDTLTSLGGRWAAAHGIQLVGASGQVVHAQEDGCAGESGRGEQTRDELAEGWGDRVARQNDALSHLGDVVRHLVNFIVENRAHTAGSHHDKRDSRGRRRLYRDSVGSKKKRLLAGDRRMLTC